MTQEQIAQIQNHINNKFKVYSCNNCGCKELEIGNAYKKLIKDNQDGTGGYVSYVDLMCPECFGMVRLNLANLGIV
jgi:hypothetical protein